jgi:uncharacterized protein (DUF58 family)
MHATLATQQQTKRDALPRRLFGPRGIDTPPLRLGQRRLYILPTRLGLLFSALLVGLLIGSANYGISLGYLFTFMLGGLGTVTMFHTHRNLSGLLLSPLPARSVFAGENAAFPLRVDNPTGLSRHALEARAEDETGYADVGARAMGEISIPAHCPTRGARRLGRITLASTWPLGLFRCWTVVEFDWSVLVYPRPAESHVPLPRALGGGRASLAEAPGEDSFSGLRGYRPGDSPRQIAWKAVARGMTLQTKQFSGQPVGTLWLDWDAAPERDIEARLSRLTRWALQADPMGGDWGMRLPGLVLPPGRGEAHMRACLEALARHGT